MGVLLLHHSSLPYSTTRRAALVPLRTTYTPGAKLPGRNAGIGGGRAEGAAGGSSFEGAGSYSSCVPTMRPAIQ
ncbi:MAG: hypothetical protein ACRYFX_12785 [Janthinobacterium lividum]